MTTILDLMERRGTPLQQQGKWAVGPCPACGGDDRFRVVRNGAREFYTCRQCDARGDAIQFLRDFEGMPFREARRLAEELQRHSNGVTFEPVQIVDPDRWFEATFDLLERARAYFTKSGRDQMRLREARGIEAETAERFMLGYVPRRLTFERCEFGLTDRTDEGGTPRRLHIPTGFTIPILSADSELLGLQIRRDDPYDGQRYYTIPGSELRPMVMPGGFEETVVVVESYLCGMLLSQETADRYTVIALGSASVRPNAAASAALDRACRVLVALDTDDAGRKQAWDYWVSRYPRASRCPIPLGYGKDPTEAHRNGMPLADWVAAGIELALEGDSTAPETEFVGTRAKVACVRTEADAIAAVDSIRSACPAIGVAISLCPRPADGQHPQAGWHPRLTRVREVAVYAKALGQVFVFEMGAVKKSHLRPLWAAGMTVVCHDCVEMLRHFAGLRRSETKLESTLLMANAITNDRLDLASALDRFGGIPPTPVQGSETDAARRALALSVLLDALRPEIKGKARQTYRRMRDAQHAVAAMEVSGFGFDVRGHSDLVTEWEEALATCVAGLPTGLDGSDDAAVRAWLMANLPDSEMKGLARTTDGRISLADENLARCTLPEIAALREHRRVAGMISRYGSLGDYRQPDNGRIHAAYLLGGASTGRIANRNPCLQNLPRDPALRRLFRAEEGCRLVVVDVSQSQLRIAAEISEDEAMLAAYAVGEDLHLRTAAEVLGVPVEGVTTEERRRAKAVNFGFLFGQGAEGFRSYAARQYGAEFSAKEAAAVRRAFLDTYTGLAAWQEDTIHEVRQTGACATPGGRVRRFDDTQNGHLAHQALAFVVQGAEAEIMLDALAAIHDGLAEHGARLVHFVHDEVVIEAPEDETTIAAVAGLAERSIADAFRRMFPQASVDGLVETSAASDWGSAK